MTCTPGSSGAGSGARRLLQITVFKARRAAQSRGGWTRGLLGDGAAWVGFSPLPMTGSEGRCLPAEEPTHQAFPLMF